MVQIYSWVGHGCSFFIQLDVQRGLLKYLFPCRLLSSEYIFLCEWNVLDGFMDSARILRWIIISLLIPRCKGFRVGGGILVILMELLYFTYNPHFLFVICEKNVSIS